MIILVRRLSIFIYISFKIRSFSEKKRKKSFVSEKYFVMKTNDDVCNEILMPRGGAAHELGPVKI